jgi:soluble lytic murein transglycosylase-like protein
MKAKSYTAAAALLTATLVAPVIARADIYGFTDEKGIKHFTNIPGLDKRYRLVRKEGPMAPRAATTSWMPSEAEIQKYRSIVASVSRTHGVDDALVHAVISAESGYNPSAVSRKGASGIMQLMPDTARRYGVQNIMDPVQNISGGVKYLKDLLAMFNGNAELAVAGYNAGENAVIRAGNRIPRYPETENYVPKVMDYYRKFQARKSA